ncbi:hypothetical protein I4F81_003288 [Pyropia yezoensis]|uniref:Uncharacterized protein n=1 Tax=Pyropia yezoensis TaxID=2788 RepID=A0ACC3BRT8_PYRYE|nr:hypothetical protein I4F81_003288 [Neopyropia yezoensis]
MLENVFAFLLELGKEIVRTFRTSSSDAAPTSARIRFKKTSGKSSRSFFGPPAACLAATASSSFLIWSALRNCGVVVILCLTAAHTCFAVLSDSASALDWRSLCWSSSSLTLEPTNRDRSPEGSRRVSNRV